MIRWCFVLLIPRTPPNLERVYSYSASRWKELVPSLEVRDIRGEDARTQLDSAKKYKNVHQVILPNHRTLYPGKSAEDICCVAPRIECWSDKATRLHERLLDGINIPTVFVGPATLIELINSNARQVGSPPAKGNPDTFFSRSPSY